MRRFPAAGARRFATLNLYTLHALDSHLAADPVRAELPAAAVRGRKARSWQRSPIARSWGGGW